MANFEIQLEMLILAICAQRLFDKPSKKEQGFFPFVNLINVHNFNFFCIYATKCLNLSQKCKNINFRRFVG